MDGQPSQRIILTGRQSRIYAAILIFTAVWCLLIFMPPLLQFSVWGRRLAFIIRLIYAPICHQNEHRSFVIAGQSLAVCARCTGIYLGFFAGLLLMPLVQRRFPRRDFFRLLQIGLVLVCIEWIVSRILPQFWSGMLRSVSGAWLGGWAALLSLPVLLNFRFKRPIERE